MPSYSAQQFADPLYGFIPRVAIDQDEFVIRIVFPEDGDRVLDVGPDDFLVIMQGRDNGNETIYFHCIACLGETDSPSFSRISKILSIFPPITEIRLGSSSERLYSIGRLSSDSLWGNTVLTSHSDSR